MTIVLAISLVCLVIYPFPTFPVPVSYAFWASHFGSLCGCTASFYTFFTWHEHFNLPVLVMLLISSILRQAWRQIVNNHDEISFMCAICILVVDVATVFYMWLPGDQWISALLLVPTALWDMHLVSHARPLVPLYDVENPPESVVVPAAPPSGGIKKPGLGLKIPRIGGIKKAAN